MTWPVTPRTWASLGYRTTAPRLTVGPVDKSVSWPRWLGLCTYMPTTELRESIRKKKESAKKKFEGNSKYPSLLNLLPLFLFRLETYSILRTENTNRNKFKKSSHHPSDTTVDRQTSYGDAVIFCFFLKNTNCKVVRAIFDPERQAADLSSSERIHGAWMGSGKRATRRQRHRHARLLWLVGQLPGSLAASTQSSTATHMPALLTFYCRDSIRPARKSQPVCPVLQTSRPDRLCKFPNNFVHISLQTRIPVQRTTALARIHLN